MILFGMTAMSAMSETKVHYKSCTPEDIQLVQRFEPEILRALETKRLVGGACWEPYVMKAGSQEFRFFQLYSTTQPEVRLGGGYGREFLEKVSSDEFYGWMAGFPKRGD